MAEISLKTGKKYKGYTLHSHDYIYDKSHGLSLVEVKTLWHEYRHQFNDKDIPPIQRVEAWISLQVFTCVLVERFAWDSSKRQPYVDVTPHNPINRAAYAQPDFYSNPNYGWCD